MRKNIADEFDLWSVLDPDTGCLNWRRGKNRGYGIVYLGGGRANRRFQSAHRFAYERAHGPVPDGLFVLHRCDNPSCVNPAHLFVGTNDENMADMVAKGRQVRGSRQHSARLSEAKVERIRLMRSELAMKRKDIATYFGVSRAMVGRVLRGETWAQVGGVPCKN